MEKVHCVFIQLIRSRSARSSKRPQGRALFLLLRGRDAMWGLLKGMKSLSGEPVCLWLPEQYKKPNTSTYVQGVEVDPEYAGSVPEGFDVIALPEAEYLMFQGEPFQEEDFRQAIGAVQLAMDRYDPTVMGYAWDDSNPAFNWSQLAQEDILKCVLSRQQTSSNVRSTSQGLCSICV